MADPLVQLLAAMFKHVALRCKIIILMLEVSNHCYNAESGQRQAPLLLIWAALHKYTLVCPPKESYGKVTSARPRSHNVLLVKVISDAQREV